MINLLWVSLAKYFSSVIGQTFGAIISAAVIERHFFK
jgi:hypothetical protein